MRDSHPHWCSFPRGLHLCLCWQYISRLQFKAGGPDFHAELVPVHSPLLRESYLVSFPPLTYMLKFSGFADLTSCLESDRRWTKAKEKRGDEHLCGERAKACMHDSSPKPAGISPCIQCVKGCDEVQHLNTQRHRSRNFESPGLANEECDWKKGWGR